MKIWRAEPTSRVNSEPFLISNGDKQATLFGLFFMQSCNNQRMVRSDSAVLHLARLWAKIKVRNILVNEFQFADDCTLIACTEAELQEVTSCFATATKNFGLIISLKRQVLYQLHPGFIYVESSISTDDMQLNAVINFCYHESCTSTSASLDKELVFHYITGI